MYRYAIRYLENWQGRRSRKPLVLRGARQVGKSYLAKQLAEKFFKNFIEINFEKNPEFSELFKVKSPQTILSQLELKLGVRILPKKSLLFLDEIQAAPEVFANLRYFYEDMPDLHVLAAGSLLEFILEDHVFSMPVGRIEYCYLGPMNFAEFLIATERKRFVHFLDEYTLSEEISPLIHQEFMKAFREYLVVGGMPASLNTYLDTRSFLECDRTKQSILSTYIDDFNKYGQRINTQRLQKVFRKLPMAVGNKFVHSRIDRNEQARDIGKALHMLSLAKVAHKVYHSSANGVPLRAETNDRTFKALFLDVGLLTRACGLSMLEFENADEVMLINSGAICEQFIGQHLLGAREFFEEPELYYWSREKSHSSAEVDYVISYGNTIIPIEVKSGKPGSLRSLHVFLNEKKRHFAVRFNSESPSCTKVNLTLTTGNTIQFKLLSLPLYAVGHLFRLLEQFVS